MSILAALSPSKAVHGEFAEYLRTTGNTICGRHPMGVLLGAIESVAENVEDVRLRWVRYEQSSACETLADSSVSYASGYVTIVQ